MADKSSQMILDALSRAASGGGPLHAGRAVQGLFPATPAGKQAAARCREEGYLHPVPCPESPESAKRKSTPPETWSLTEKGLAYLIGHISPREVLNDLVRAVEARESQLDEMLASVNRGRDELAALRTAAETVLALFLPPDPHDNTPNNLNTLFESFRQKNRLDLAMSNGAATPPAANSLPLDTAIMESLGASRDNGACTDYPLPKLFRAACDGKAAATVGQFHDALRRLHDAGRIYLHPWTGPLYEVPEPPFALLVGHEVAYYASLRAGR